MAVETVEAGQVVAVRPCAFCGGAAVSMVHDSVRNKCFLRCTACCACGPESSIWITGSGVAMPDQSVPYMAAMHHWNKRASDQESSEWRQKYVDAAEELRDLKRGQTEAESVTADLFRDVMTRMKAAVSSCPEMPDNSPTAEECSAVGEIADDLFPLPKTLRGE